LAKLPVVSGEDTVRGLETFGWRVARRARGSHIILVKLGSIYSLSIPDHKEVAKGTLRKILRIVNLSVEEFAQAL
jgi:predicted RNA binding protein YcfA (HicA-like mRNA interferase family)